MKFKWNKAPQWHHTNTYIVCIVYVLTYRQSGWNSDLDFLFYRLNTVENGTAFAGLWTQSISGSIYRTIHQQNMDDSSYNDVETSVEKVINLPNQAYYGTFGALQTMKLHCKVKHYYQIGASLKN